MLGMECLNMQQSSFETYGRCGVRALLGLLKRELGESHFLPSGKAPRGGGALHTTTSLDADLAQTSSCSSKQDSGPCFLQNIVILAE